MREFLIIFAEKSKTGFFLIIIKCNYFKKHMFIEKTSEISDSKLKINSIVELFKSSNTFVYLIFKKLSTIEKKICRKSVIYCSFKKIRFLRHMKTTVCHIQ